MERDNQQRGWRANIADAVTRYMIKTIIELVVAIIALYFIKLVNKEN